MIARASSAFLLALFTTAGCAQDAQPAPPYETRFEIGVGGVWVGTHGSQAKFLSDRYLRSGWNASSVSFDLRPAEAARPRFDFLTFSATNLGDAMPYQGAQFRVAKRKLYDFQADYRKSNLFFDLPSFALGLHPSNSVNRNGGARLKLFGDRTLSFHAGYRRNQHYGTFFSTRDVLLDTFQTSTPKRATSDQYSGGLNLKTRPLVLAFDQHYVFYRDDTQVLPNPLNPIGFNGNRFNGGGRDTPVRISMPVSTLAARYHPVERFEVSGRYRYSGAQLNVNRFDNLTLGLGSGNLPLRQLISSSGTGDRPAHMAGTTLTVDLTPRLSFHQRTLVDRYSLTGFLDTFGVLQSAANTRLPGFDIEEHVGGRVDLSQVRNEFDLEAELAKGLNLLAGYRYNHRDLAIGAGRGLTTRTHSGLASLGWAPVSKLRLRAEVERSGADTAFDRIEPLSSLRWKLRAEFRPTQKISFLASTTQSENRNDTSGIRLDLNDRQWSGQVVVLPGAGVQLSGGYNYARLHSSTDVAFLWFATLTNSASIYQTDTHVLHWDGLFPIAGRATLRLGYNLVKDIGLSYPFSMHVPRAGISVKLSRIVWFETDWQHFAYRRTYGANVLSTGLRFTR
ncbi:MAG: hypothetical protein HY822_23270 [Acidobacteria bacterium]|nr:hypothetical protein [Acidobacteriota bacterium]